MSLFLRFLAVSNNYYKLVGIIANELMTSYNILEVLECLYIFYFKIGDSCKFSIAKFRIYLT